MHRNLDVLEELLVAIGALLSDLHGLLAGGSRLPSQLLDDPVRFVGCRLPALRNYFRVASLGGQVKCAHGYDLAIVASLFEIYSIVEDITVGLALVLCMRAHTPNDLRPQRLPCSHRVDLMMLYRLARGDVILVLCRKNRRSAPEFLMNCRAFPVRGRVRAQTRPLRLTILFKLVLVYRLLLNFL